MHRLPIDLLKELRALTADEDGAQRWPGPILAQGPRVVSIEAARVARGASLDAAGNSWATLPGESEKGSDDRQPPGLRAERRLARRLPGRDGGARSAAAASPRNTMASRR